MALYFSGYRLNMRTGDTENCETQWHIGENKSQCVRFWVEKIQADGHELEFLREAFFPKMKQLPRVWEIDDSVIVAMIAETFRKES